MIPGLQGLVSKVQTLLDRLTATRAGYLDNLDAAISTRASASVWTSALATQLAAYDIASKSAVLTSGSGNWPVPDNVSVVWVTACGGGGSGAVAAGNNSCDAGGGGAGASFVRFPIRVTPGFPLAYTVGTGGAAVTRTTAGGTNGNAGTATVIGGWSASGGAGGTHGYLATAAGGAGGWSTADVSATPVSVPGGNGGVDGAATSPVPWRAAGAGANNSLGGFAGGGGASYWGIGRAGISSSTSTASADDATSGGGGGGARVDGVDDISVTSGAGGDGYILIEYIG